MTARTHAALLLGNFGSLGRCKRIMVIGNFTNTGANPNNVVYRCPAERAAIITALAWQPRGGTAYGIVSFNVRIGATGTAADVFASNPPATFRTTEWTGSLWLMPDDDLRAAGGGGDGTSDYRVMVSGLEFDWSDFGADFDA